jgi:hypothetical protein
MLSLNLKDDESLKAYLAPAGLVSEPRGDLTCRGVEDHGSCTSRVCRWIK